MKNRYIGRSFIAPGQQERADAVRRKLNPLADAIAGKRLVVVDDSIVRGTTQRSVIRMLREAGAAEVHLRISSPPVALALLLRDRHARRTRSCWRPTTPSRRWPRILGADSLAYISIENLKAGHRRRRRVLRRLLHRRLPDAGAAVATPVSLRRPEPVAATAHQAALPGV